MQTSASARAAIPPSSHISTSSIPERDRLAWWLDWICTLYCRLDCEPPSEEGIFGEIDVLPLGESMLTRVRSNGRRVRQSPAQARQHAQEADHMLALVMREGRGRALQDGRCAELRAGNVILHDSTRPYELRFESPSHDLCAIRVSRAQLAPHVRNLDRLTACALPREHGGTQLLVSMVESLHAMTLPQRSAPGVSAALAGALAAGLCSLPEASLRGRQDLSAHHIARVKSYVQQHLRDRDLCVASIARALQLSPDHLSRLFRTEPTPLQRLIWQQRLEGCKRDLAAASLANHSATDIAFSWGFGNASHFSRCFRACYSMSPSEWRVETSRTGGDPGDS
jgi:AraC-like DNA-binding protein